MNANSYEYRMKSIIKNFAKDYDLSGFDAEELQHKIWTEHAKEFGRAVLEDMSTYSGTELFEE